MSHITTQTFRPQALADDIETVGKILDLMAHGQINDAKQLLVVYHDNLLMKSHPQVVPYDQRTPT